ncbi:MAG: hypothetical protein P8J87_02955 [Verrucomicrobiales bacterium]|nr:hypothetical protein [Verrucomicrobiales bacterium]
MKRPIITLLATLQFATAAPFKIEVVDRGNGWPVPLVHLTTTHNLTFTTDNAGVVAIDTPELIGRETWFTVHSDGYQLPADGFGNRGFRLTPSPGGSAQIKVTRTIIAKRLGRLTGAGLFAESQKLGGYPGYKESGISGCDSIQIATHRDKKYWLWGDSNLPKYPLGIFHMTGATTPLNPLTSFQPPLELDLDYFRDPDGKPRAVARMPGPGPTWLNGFISLPDKTGTPHLVATYSKIRNFLEVYELGLCTWNEASKNFDRSKILWQKSTNNPKPIAPEGHPVLHTDPAGKTWALFADPFPTLKMPATFEAWQDPAQWQKLEPQPTLESATDTSSVKPHRGSITYNHYRKKWLTVFTQIGGTPSPLGELWYAESNHPTGPWGNAVKILSHDNYSFYNPRLHPGFTPKDSPVLLFEGTYTHTFSNNPTRTPRYDYNQILYRLDLDDPALTPTHAE